MKKYVLYYKGICLSRRALSYEEAQLEAGVLNRVYDYAPEIVEL